MYSHILFFGVLGVISFLIIKPFLTVLIGAIILAYTFHPVYVYVNNKIKNDNVSAFLTSMIVIAVALIPLTFIANFLFQESVIFFHSINDIISSSFFNELSKYFGENIDFDSHLKSALNNLTVFVIKSISNFIISLPSKLISLLILFITTFYFFKSGKNFIEKAKEIIPLNKIYSDALFGRSKEIMSSIIYGTFVIAVVESVLALIGFSIFGYSSPFLLSIIVFILAFLPAIGASVLWIPLSILKIYQGDFFSGIGFIVYASLTITMAELWLRPKVIGERANVHPVLILFGALGGFSFMGIMGVVIGPIVLDLFISFLRLVGVEKREVKSKASR